MEEIKKCPFCGNDGILSASWNSRQGCWFVYVRCEMCRASGRTKRARHDPAADNWNNEECESAVKYWNMRYENGNV